MLLVESCPSPSTLYNDWSSFYVQKCYNVHDLNKTTADSHLHLKASYVDHMSSFAYLLCKGLINLNALFPTLFENSKFINCLVGSWVSLEIIWFCSNFTSARNTYFLRHVCREFDRASMLTVILR